MQYILLADVHANLSALEAVLLDIAYQGFEVGMDLRKVVAGNRGLQPHPEAPAKILNLGDVLDYGPSPNETLALMHQVSTAHILGNYDETILQLQDPSFDPYDVLNMYHPHAQESLRWTADALTPKSLGLLRSQELQDVCLQIGDAGFYHSNPLDPRHYSVYIEDEAAARMTYFNQQQIEAKRVFVGHSHIPQVYGQRHPKSIDGGRLGIIPSKVKFTRTIHPSVDAGDINPRLVEQRSSPEAPVRFAFPLGSYPRALMVVPSVGQPRDNHPETGYAVYDPDADAVTYHRLPYDVERTINAMQEKQLPALDALRLRKGL